MKKTLLLTGAAAVVFAFSANALELTPYIAAKLTFSDLTAKTRISDLIDGETWFRNDLTENRLGGSLAAGVAAQLNSGALRTELEFIHNADIKDRYTMDGWETTSKLRTQAYMLNFYYDFDTDSKFTPYVGAGVGYAKVKANLINNNINTSDNNLAWQLGAGISYAMNDNLSIDAGYRYMDYGDLSETSSWGRQGFLVKSSLDTSANEVYVGLRYSF